MSNPISDMASIRDALETSIFDASDIDGDDAWGDIAPHDGKRAKEKPPLERKERVFKSKRVIAYDLETTRIKEGTPEVRYVTAFCGDERKPYRLSKPVNNLTELLFVLETEMLIPENHGARFVAWNGNKYDAFFVIMALLKSSDEWEVSPFLTKGKSLRGAKIKHKTKTYRNAALQFELLDGMAMTGLDTVGMGLKKYLSLYAPDFSKLDLNFEQEEFDAKNLDHIAYADRDAEGLWHAMTNANVVIKNLTGSEFQSTLGRLAITYFQANMPPGIQVWEAPEDVQQILHGAAKRGGYVWTHRRVKQERLWKYDINQAYAAAMRDCALPAGSLSYGTEFVPDRPGLYHVTISRDQPSHALPFYCRSMNGAAIFCTGEKTETWILSNEVEHLRRDKWNVEIHEARVWSEQFNMAHMVSELERLRFSDPQGPSGPLGLIVKTLGNSAYGKTLEVLDGESVIISTKCPGPDYTPYSEESFSNLWAKREEPQYKAYHRPQLGCFITAHVRNQVREAALAAVDAFVACDTDGLLFTRAVTHLDIDPRRYGAWKLEKEGVPHTTIAKKVYVAHEDGRADLHAKGMRVKELSEKHMLDWYDGILPKQTQIQRNNLLKHIAGAPMFRSQEREGTNVFKSKSVKLEGDIFLPV